MWATGREAGRIAEESEAASLLVRVVRVKALSRPPERVREDLPPPVADLVRADLRPAATPDYLIAFEPDGLPEIAANGSETEGAKLVELRQIAVVATLRAELDDGPAATTDRASCDMESRRWDSNPRPTDYKSVALTTELLRQPFHRR